MGDRVEIRSDHDYLGRPLAFYWQDERLEVTEVLAQTRSPHGCLFRVRGKDAGVFELFYDADTDEWSVQPI